ncbi:MAG TPA: hypothetical protein VFV66_00970 [Nonomuraea sp.]|nr:hypothetical protein [Nonomuraea sp.]
MKALKKQYVTGQGVRISETSVTKLDGKTTTSGKTAIRLAFGRSGVTAAELSSKARRGVSLSPDRLISIGGYTYVQGGIYGKELPEGKKWVRYAGAATGTTVNQPFDIFEPKVLRTLVGKAKSVKGGTYKGAMTYKELGRLYGENVTGQMARIKLDYVLTLNAKGLATRLVTGITLDFGMLGKATSNTDTRFSSWGSKTTIKAPAEDLWIDAKDLDPESEVPEEMPDELSESGPPLINERRMATSGPLGR